MYSMVERPPAMREVTGSIPSRVKETTLQFVVLLLCFNSAQHIRETERPARRHDNGLGWDITTYPRRGVSVG